MLVLALKISADRICMCIYYIRSSHPAHRAVNDCRVTLEYQLAYQLHKISFDHRCDLFITVRVGWFCSRA